MSTIADLVIKLSANTGDAEKDISSFGSKTAGLMRKSLLPAVGVLGGLGVAAKRAADDASDLGEAQNAVSVVFGKSSKTVAEFARVADKQAGLSMRQLNELVTPVGASLRNYGFSAQDAATNSVNLAKRAADMASVFNTSVPEALQAIQAGLRGEADPLERFGVGLSASAVQAKALSMGLGKTTVDVGKVKDAQLRATVAQDKYTESVKKHGKDSNEAKTALLTMHSAQNGVTKALEGGTTQLSNHALMQARLALVMDQTNRLQGDFARTSGGVANAARINAAEQENLSAKFGKGVLPAMQMYQKLLGGVLGLLGDHTGATQVLIGVVGGLAAVIILVNVGMKAYAAGQVVVQAATKGWAAAQWLLNAALSANPVALVIIGIVALGAALVALWMKSQTFRDIVTGVWNGVKSVVSSVVSFIEGLWDRFGSKLTAAARSYFGAIASIIGGQLNVVRGIFNAVAGLLTGDWGRAWDGVKQVARGALQALGGIIRAAGAGLLGAALSVGKGIAEGILHGIGGLASDLASSLRDKVSSAISSVKGFLHINSPSKLVASELGSPIGEGIVYGFLMGVADLPAKMSDKIRTALEAAKQQVDAARSSFTSSFQGLTSVVDQAFDAIQNTAKTKSEKLLDRLVSAHDAEQFKANLDAAKAAAADAKSALSTFDADPTQAGSLDPAQAAQKRLELGTASVAAQKQVDDLLYQQKVASLQQTAAIERVNLNATLAIRKQHLDASLQALSAHLVKERATAGEATKETLKLLGSYGIDFKAVGANMGKAWIQGLKDALNSASKGAGKLSGTISKAADDIPGFASGVRNFEGGMAWVGENGPELVHLPGGSSVFSNSESRRMEAGNGGPLIGHVTVQNEVDVEVLARRVARVLAFQNGR